MTFDDPAREEQCLIVNAREHDLLPGVMWDWRTDLDFDDRLSRYGELADCLLQLVDPGLIEARRLSGEDRYEVIAREHLGDVLADAAVWSYTEHGWDHRDEGLAIVETPPAAALRPSPARTQRDGSPVGIASRCGRRWRRLCPQRRDHQNQHRRHRLVPPRRLVHLVATLR